MAPLLKAEVRQQIIALWETGLRHMDISKRLGISRTTVYFWIRRYEQEGAIIKRKRQNYPRATTAEQDQEIVEARLMDNSSKTLACLYSVSPRTITRRLNQAGMALSAVGKRKKSRKVRSKTVKSGPPHSEVKRRSKRTKTNVHSAETDTQISDVSMAEDGGTSGDEDGVAEPLTLDVDAGESDLEPAAVPLQATSQDKESDPLCTDDRSHCSGCGDVLTGLRYVCVQCAAFELCAACEAAGGHGLHYALRVPRGRPQEEIAAMIKKIREELCKHKIPVEGIIKDEMDVEPDPLGVVEGTEISPEEAADFQPINVESQMAVEGTDCQTTSDVSSKGRQTLMKESLNMIYDDVIIHETPQSERNESSSMKHSNASSHETAQAERNESPSMKHNNATSHETPQSEINESTSIKHNNANRHEISQSEKNECPSVKHNNATSHESPQTEINESLSMKHNNAPCHGTPPPERNKSPSMKHNDAPCHKTQQSERNESPSMKQNNAPRHGTPQSERNESPSMKHNNATSHETPQSEKNESPSIKHNNANRHEISQSEKNECPSVNHNNATSHESPQTEINESLSMKHNNEPSHGTPPPERNKSPSMKHNDAPCHKTPQSERNESPSLKHNNATSHETPQSEINESPSMKHNNANRHEIPQTEKNECPSLKHNNATSHESPQTERNKSPSMKHNNAPSHGTPQSEINESPSMKHNNAPSHGTPQSERNESLSMKRKYALSQKFSLSEIKKFLRMKHNAPSHINPQSKIKELLRMNHNNAPNHETPQSQIKEALRMKHNALNDKCLQPQIKFLKMILPTQATRQSNSVAQNDKDIVDATPEVTDIEKDLDDSEEDLDDSEEEADSETVLITEPPSSKLNAMSTNIMCPSLPQISTNSVASNDKDVVDAASVVTDIENDGDEREEAANSKMVMITEPSSSKLNAMSTNTICPSIPQTASNSVASNDEDVIDAAPEVTDIKEELDDSDEESDGEMIMITEPPSSKLMAMSTNIICPNILQPVLVMRNFTPAPGARYVLLSGPQPVGGVSALGPATVAPRIVQRGASNTQLSRPN